MTFQQELASWNPFSSGPQHEVAPAPSSGSRAPSAGELTFPRADGKPVVVTFLRHCGCPFAEKTFQDMRKLADSDSPSGSGNGTAFVAVSHSDEPATKEWLEGVGGKGNVEVIVDHDRRLYAAWGLGASSFWHVLNPSVLGNVGKYEGIGVRPTQSGTRWQTAGSFAVDTQGVVKWARPAQRADEIPDFEEAVGAVKA